MKPPVLSSARKALRCCASKVCAEGCLRFFKTGCGEYGEGDRFLGVSVPEVRKIAKEFVALSDAEVTKLLKSPWHEERLLGLIIWTYQVERAVRVGDKKRAKKIAGLYLKNVAAANNWDLVDLSCYKILGLGLGYQVLPRLRMWAQLPPIEKVPPQRRPKGVLPATSRALCVAGQRRSRLWQKRIAMVTTFHFLGLGDPRPTLELAEILLVERHDLLQKALGWMLRELGKRCGEKLLTTFLNSHAPEMGRTALRYAVERLPAQKRAKYARREI